MSVALFEPNGAPAAGAPALLIDLKELSRLLTRSEASLQRDVDAGRIPNPIRIGRSVRWRRADIESWIAGGCEATNRSSARHRPVGHGARS